MTWQRAGLVGQRGTGLLWRGLSVCKLCERGKKNFKYGPSKRRDLINSLEDLAEQLYKWKSPGVAYGEKRKYEAGYNSMVADRRIAIKYHGLDVTCKE